VWEVFEFTADGVFGSNLSEGNTDTVGDLIGENRFEEVSA